MEPRRALQQSSIMEGLVTLHLKVYGIWYSLNVIRTTGKISRLFVLNLAFLIFLGLSYPIFQFIHIFLIDIDLKKIASIYLIVAPCMQTFNKSVFFLIKLRNICFIYDLLQEDFLESIPDHKMSVAKDIYRRTAKKCNKVCLFAYSGVFFTWIVWFFVPGFDTDDPTSGRKKILNGWYPFRYSESPRYELIYSYEFVVTMWGGGWYCVSECAILIPLICLCSHFDVLSYHVATLKKGDKLQVLGRKSASCVEDNVFLNDQLKYILKNYEKLIRYGDTIKETYNLIITIILGVEIGNLTVIMLHLIFEEKDALFIVRTGSFLSFQLIEVVLICYCSEMMATASSGMREALYCNEWYTSDRKLATSLQLMMVRASVPLTLTAIKMYPVNMETLLSHAIVDGSRLSASSPSNEGFLEDLIHVEANFGTVVGIFQFIYSTAALLSKTT